jgi:hypothetical protein
MNDNSNVFPHSSSASCDNSIFTVPRSAGSLLMPTIWEGSPSLRGPHAWSRPPSLQCPCEKRPSPPRHREAAASSD